MDAGGEIRAELGGRPDLIIGNYSDGNLVASLLSFHLNVTQCTIAHALEKTKYPDADINWCAPLITPFMHAATGDSLRCVIVYMYDRACPAIALYLRVRRIIYLEFYLAAADLRMWGLEGY